MTTQATPRPERPCQASETEDSAPEADAPVSSAPATPAPAAPDREAQACAICAKIREATDASDHGLSIFDGAGRLVLCNRWLKEHFVIPERLAAPGASMDAYFRHFAEIGEFGEGDPEILVDRLIRSIHDNRSFDFERTRPNGSILRIEINSMTSGGHFAVITDVTQEREAERKLKRQMEDLKAARATVERHAREIARLAEKLAAQKKLVEAAKVRSDYLAAHEALTGLPNRRTLIERLNDAVAGLAPGRRLAVLFVDLDKFKQVNDSFGHERGDAHLVEVAERLRRAAREQHFVARLGGDEFAVIVELPEDEGPEDLRRIADQFLEELRIPVEGPEGSVRTSASIGAAICPDQARDPSGLLTLADRTMYRAKAAGGDRVMMAADSDEPARAAG